MPDAFLSGLYRQQTLKRLADALYAAGYETLSQEQIGFLTDKVNGWEWPDSPRWLHWQKTLSNAVLLIGGQFRMKWPRVSDYPWWMAI